MSKERITNLRNEIKQAIEDGEIVNALVIIDDGKETSVGMIGNALDLAVKSTTLTRNKTAQRFIAMIGCIVGEMNNLEISKKDRVRMTYAAMDYSKKKLAEKEAKELKEKNNY
jgi:hypothetical protein